MPIRCGCARCSPTWWPTRSSSPSAARWWWTCGAPLGTPQQLEFDVRDTGIASRRRPAAPLHAFTQANGGMSRRYGGTGLGLAISRQLVELMGGRIDVRSAPGIGSEFRFSVPIGWWPALPK